MKKVAVIVLVLSFVATANASLVLKDTFTAASYPTALVGHTPDLGGGPWAAHSGTTGPIQIVADHPPLGADGSVLVHQETGYSEDDNAPYTGSPAGAGSRFWAGFCVKVNATEPLAKVWFAHMKDSGTTNFAGRVGVGDLNSVTDFNFALYSGGTNIAATYPGNFLYGTWHRVVTNYEFNTGIQQMWVDPDPNLGPYDVGQVPYVQYTGYSGTALIGYGLRQTGGLTSNQTIDNLAVGNSDADWPDVASPCIPEPATMALLGLGCLALMRRR